MKIDKAARYGYAGKILRINLTEQTTQIIPTENYLPEYLGGRIMADKIFWDEVKEAVPALDPRNKLIYMTGPCAATGLPISGRAVMTGISAKNLPEQYTHSSIGGYFGSMLKWAGYDGFILEGRAAEHTYVYIQDDSVSFLNADDLWGKYVIDTQQALFKRHGSDAYSLVIGPAGENLHRCASIATHADSVAAKTGFGAVMGSKNLKAIVVRGTGVIRPAHAEQVLELRTRVGDPANQKAPLCRVQAFSFSHGRGEEPAPEGAAIGRLSCNQGCNVPCMLTKFNVFDPLDPGQRVSMVGKCLDEVTENQQYDSDAAIGIAIHSHRQEKPGSYTWMVPTHTDDDDPDLNITLVDYPGDRMNLSKPSHAFSQLYNWLCNQYGLDKWDMTVWYLSWLSMCKQEGLLDELDFGMEYKPSDEAFARKFVDDMVYRRTPLGNVFAEGMARAIRILGKEKYGDSIYHNRYNSVTGERLDIPVSLESGWGECSHWQGRGFQGCQKYLWLATSLTDMVGSRDEICGQHFHDWIENYIQYKDDPSHSSLFMQKVAQNIQFGTLKDSLVLCEYKSPTPYWEDMEVEMLRAAIGADTVTREELLAIGERGRLLERAIFMRNHARTRDLEVEEIYPYLTYPDPFGQTMDWDEWNDAVSLFYDVCGWDRETGWPLRETWERYGLQDIADELAQLGMVPEKSNTSFRHKENPFHGHIRADR